MSKTHSMTATITTGGTVSLGKKAQEELAKKSKPKPGKDTK